LLAGYLKYWVEVLVTIAEHEVRKLIAMHKLA
jgi:hypothetical protein